MTKTTSDLSLLQASLQDVSIIQDVAACRVHLKDKIPLNFLTQPTLLPVMSEGPYNFGQKHAFVTGGSNGIGLAIAKLLLRRGSSISFSDIADPAVATKTLTDVMKSEGLPGKVHYVKADVSKYDQVSEQCLKTVRIITWRICKWQSFPPCPLQHNRSSLRQLSHLSLLLLFSQAARWDICLLCRSSKRLLWWKSHQSDVHTGSSTTWSCADAGRCERSGGQAWAHRLPHTQCRGGIWW